MSFLGSRDRPISVIKKFCWYQHYSEFWLLYLCLAFIPNWNQEVERQIEWEWLLLIKRESWRVIQTFLVSQKNPFQVCDVSSFLNKWISIPSLSESTQACHRGLTWAPCSFIWISSPKFLNYIIKLFFRDWKTATKSEICHGNFKAKGIKFNKRHYS